MPWGFCSRSPHILDSGERVSSLSLGAGNTPGGHDLVTDRRIAEFKFTRGRDAARQSHLFVDLFNLASADTDKLRCMYVAGIEAPLRFLKGRRSLDSVLGKVRHVIRKKCEKEARARYGPVRKKAVHKK